MGRPQSPGGSDSFIGGFGTATLFPTDYPSPSLTGWAATAGVSSRTGLFFRATDASALLTGGVRLPSKTKNPCNCSRSKPPFGGGSMCKGSSVGFDANTRITPCRWPVVNNYLVNATPCRFCPRRKCRVKGLGCFGPWSMVQGTVGLGSGFCSARTVTMLLGQKKPPREVGGNALHHESHRRVRRLQSSTSLLAFEQCHSAPSVRSS